MRTPAFLLLALLVGFPSIAHAADEELDAVGHTADGYYLDYSPMGKVELPRIFLVRQADGSMGLDMYGSTASALRSGKYVAELDGEHAAEGDEPHGEPGLEAVQEVPAASLEAAAEDMVAEGSHLHASLVAAGGAKILVDFSISRHLVFMLFAICILGLLFLPLAGKYKKGIGRTRAPQGVLQNMLETVIIYVRDDIAKPNLGDKTDKYLPYLLTAFFFILICNLLGLVPFGATATANISVTAVLAIFTFVITQFAGTKDYWMHIFNPPGMPFLVKVILVPVEILGIFTKPFALAIRLFANLTAGHLVILNLVGLIFIIGRDFGTVAGFGTSIPATAMVLFVYGLEVLVAFIQAYVFTILSALFIGIASAEHEHDHDHSTDHAPDSNDAAIRASSPLVNGNMVTEPQRTVGTEAALA